MPIYDYTCTNCSRTTEVIHRINDSGPRFCPECGAEGTMRKAFSKPAIVFKGSGWAKVDRRSSSGSSGGRSKARASEDASTASGSDGGATSGSSTSTGTASSSSGPAESAGAGGGDKASTAKDD